VKKGESVIGGVYSDGKKRLRRVVAEGAQFAYEGQTDTDCVQYEILAGKRPAYRFDLSPAGNPLQQATRASFAA